jgi:predicted nucleic acid-binding Zn ribbon protein
MLTRLLFTPARSIATSSFRLFANNAEVELRATQLRLETLKREEDKLKSKKKTLVVRVRASAEREKALDQKFREKERELIKKEKLREQQCVIVFFTAFRMVQLVWFIYFIVIHIRLAAKAKADAIPKKPTRALTAVSAFIKVDCQSLGRLRCTSNLN